jgi:hypothetical protein
MAGPTVMMAVVVAADLVVIVVLVHLNFLSFTT